MSQQEGLRKRRTPLLEKVTRLVGFVKQERAARREKTALRDAVSDIQSAIHDEVIVGLNGGEKPYNLTLHGQAMERIFGPESPFVRDLFSMAYSGERTMDTLSRVIEHDLIEPLFSPGNDHLRQAMLNANMQIYTIKEADYYALLIFGRSRPVDVFAFGNGERDDGLLLGAVFADPDVLKHMRLSQLRYFSYQIASRRIIVRSGMGTSNPMQTLDNPGKVEDDFRQGIGLDKHIYDYIVEHGAVNRLADFPQKKQPTVL